LNFDFLLTSNSSSRTFLADLLRLSLNLLAAVFFKIVKNLLNAFWVLEVLLHLRGTVKVFKLTFLLLVGAVSAYFSSGVFCNPSTVFALSVLRRYWGYHTTPKDRALMCPTFVQTAWVQHAETIHAETWFSWFWADMPNGWAVTPKYEWCQKVNDR